MYQALYRKWRPQVFADVVGQDHITTTLMNEIKTGRHSHAYLFTGSRGTGKTTCAKIFAKAVNCEHPVDGDPCNECETCRGIDSGAVMDVIEIDAASNNGVDNIRDIRDEANFTPVGGKYRVYIIDEVHMLSTGAFNALLKTLEEPPEHVKFVLATTEVHKLPATILSRCQRFDFKRITPEDISKRLAYVAENEGLDLEADAAMLIARLADGALRDALSILDQCIGHSRHIDLNVVNITVGLAGKEYLFSLSNFILSKNGAGALEKINELHNRSCDMERLCNELINHFRNIMICKAVKSPKDLIVCSEDELQEYISLASAYPMDNILEVLNVLGDTITNLRKGLNRRVEMEMAVVRLCSGSFGGAVNTVAQPSIAAHTPTAEVLSNKTAPVSAANTVFEQPTQIHTVHEEQPVPVKSTTNISTPAATPEPVSEPMIQTPQAPPIMPDETMANHVSLQDTLPDGPIPTNIWNALVREVVNTDKSLIGTMNSAKAFKRGDSILINTDNILLKRFLPTDPHRQTFYNATFTVLGEYLNPVITDEEFPIQTEQQVEAVQPIATEQQKAEEPKADPLDSFISQIQNDKQIDFNFYIEE